MEMKLYFVASSRFLTVYYTFYTVIYLIHKLYILIETLILHSKTRKTCPSCRYTVLHPKIIYIIFVSKIVSYVIHV